MKFYICVIILLQFSLEVSGFEDQPININSGLSNFKNLQTSNHIRIAAASLSHLVEKNNTGIYQQIFQRAVSETGFKVTELYSPFRRALAEFEHNQVDCTYSFTEVLENKLGKEAVIASYPLGAFSIYMFTKKNTEAIININDLKGLRVGGINGQEQYYIEQIPKEVKIQPLHSDKQGLDMLQLKRLDVFIAALPDISPYLGLVSFDERFPIYESYDRMTCHNTEKNRDFLSSLSLQLEKLKLNGVYKKIAGELYIDF